MTMMNVRTLAAAAMTAAFSWIPLQAHAGLLSDDEARKAIIDLRTKVEALRHDMDAGLDAKADKTSSLELNTQNEDLHNELAKLRGEVEVLANELANAQQRQKDFYADLDARLRKLEPQKMTVDGKEALVDPAEKKAHDAALNLFRSGDYKGAGNAFTDFLRTYPDSAYAASAQYWLGNVYYIQHDYRNAISALQLVIKNYPDSEKAPDAMINIAASQVEIKEKAAAKKTLETLIAKYPDASAAQTAKERLRSLK
jgi:tol-pal system protein YbgF